MKYLLSRLPLCLATLSCLLLTQCAQHPMQSRSPAESGWRVASKTPLIYCPPGHALPPRNHYDPPQYVSLADKQTRFYLPRGEVVHLRQALAWREASLAEQKRQTPGWKNAGHGALTLTKVVCEVTGRAVLGAVLVAGLAAGSSAGSGL